MEKMQKFSINRESLVIEENDDYILTKVPNSKGQNYALFNRDQVTASNDKTYIVQLDPEAQIAMWNGQPHMNYAINAQEHADYNNANVVRLSAAELYNEYYTYSASSDPSVAKKRELRQAQFAKQKGQPEEQVAAKNDSNNSKAEVSAEQDQANRKAVTQAERVTAQKIYYNTQQMAEILKGVMQGVDTSCYRNVEMAASQMKELRLGLKAGVDVSAWNNKEITAQAMRELRLGAKKLLEIKDIDISKYDAAQLHELRLGMKQLPIAKLNNFLNSDYDAAQMRELRLGLKAGLDISNYQDVHFTADQMQMIRHRLVLQRVIEILRNIVEEAKIWLSVRLEHVSDLLKTNITVPQVHDIMKDMPPEQTPMEQIKDILVKSEMLDAATMDNEAVNTLMMRRIEDMVASIQNQSVPEHAAIEQTAAAIVEENQSVGEAQTEMKQMSEAAAPQLDKDTLEQIVEQQTEIYVELMQGAENAVVMEA